MSVSRKLIWIGVLGSLLLAACGAGGPTTGTPEANIPIVADTTNVISEGRLEPETHAQLAFLAGGQVEAVLVKEGDQVKAGDVIARLKNREQLQAEVARAEAEQLNAAQAVQALQDNAALAAAQLQQQLAQTQESLDKAERKLKSLKSPDLQFYQDQLKKVQDALATAQENAQITQIGDLENALQAARDRLKTATDIVNDAQKSQADCPGCEFVFAAAAGGMVKLDDARKELANATDAVRVLELRIAQAQRGDEQTIKDLQKQVEDAKYAAASVGNPDVFKVTAYEAEVAALKAQIEDYQRRRPKLQAGPDPDQLATAEARVKTAEAALAAAQTALTNLELRAPIDGVVAEVKLKVGEQASPGVPVVTLAELGHWVIKTSNLTEIEVVKVKEGQPVEVTLDALPGVTLKGTVKSIASVFQESRGDIVYTVTVALDETDPRARWGMTAQVTITP